MSKKVNESYIEVKQLGDNVKDAKNNVIKLIEKYKTKIDDKKHTFINDRDQLYAKIQKVKLLISQVLDRTDQNEESYGLAIESKEMLESASNRLMDVENLEKKINKLRMAGT